MAPYAAGARSLADHEPGAFERDGYVLLPRLLAPELIGALRAAVAELRASVAREPGKWRDTVVYQRECRPEQLAHLSDAQRREAGAQVFVVGDLARHVPAVRALVRSPLLTGLAASALGEPVRFHFSNLTLRAAGVGCSTPWHRDFPNRFCCGADERQLRLFVCLDGMTEEQGAVCVAAGSQRWTDAQWSAFRCGEGVGPAAPIRTLECPPGSVIALRGTTVHCVLPNVSGRPRANLIAQYGACSNPLVVGAPELG